jgi:hypothetical protein
VSNDGLRPMTGAPLIGPSSSKEPIPLYYVEYRASNLVKLPAVVVPNRNTCESVVLRSPDLWPRTSAVTISRYLPRVLTTKILARSYRRRRRYFFCTGTDTHQVSVQNMAARNYNNNHPSTTYDFFDSFSKQINIIDNTS